MHAWEHKLATKSTDRVVRPFDWGLEWTDNWPFDSAETDPEARILDLNRLALAHSQEFFDYCPPRDFHLHDSLHQSSLRFTSAAPSPCEANNTVYARWFPANPRFRRGNKAVVVLPHWNASPQQHVALCEAIAKLGISTLRISLPYHDRRLPPELTRADYAVSANIGRTLDATRQAVIDVRSCYDWLQQQGYTDLGIVGTSLGSCYAFLASAHDARIKVDVFNHCATYFADVVWTGLSTRHIVAGMEGHIDLPAAAAAAWDAISPVHYMDRFAALNKRSFFLYTTYDTTFLQRSFLEQVIEHLREAQCEPYSWWCCHAGITRTGTNRRSSSSWDTRSVRFSNGTCN